MSEKNSLLNLVDGEASRIDDSVKKQLIFKLSYSQGPLGVKGKKKKKKKKYNISIFISLPFLPSFSL